MGDASDAACLVVVILKLLVAAAVFGVTVLGLNVQSASAGSPEHERVIEPAKDP